MGDIRMCYSSRLGVKDFNAFPTKSLKTQPYVDILTGEEVNGKEWGHPTIFKNIFVCA